MTLDEIPLIEETLRNYGKSFNEWNIEKLASAFHPEAMTYWFIPERGGFLKGYSYGWIRLSLRNQKENPGTNYITFPEEIDYEGTAETVQIYIWEEFDDVRMENRDFLSLLKLESK